MCEEDKKKPSEIRNRHERKSRKREREREEKNALPFDGKISLVLSFFYSSHDVHRGIDSYFFLSSPPSNERKTTNNYRSVEFFFCFFSSVCHHLRLCLVSNKMQMQLQPRREETSSKAMFYMVESTRIEKKRYIDFIEYCLTTNGRKKATLIDTNKVKTSNDRYMAY